MSGKRLRSFRQGDLAEGMGLEMLRRVSLVAPVPRSEDVGVDAVCTLLRPDNALLFAENTFGVQVKAASTRELKLDANDWRWLRDFDLPIFWLSVDLRSASATMYSLVNAFAPGTIAMGARDRPPGGTARLLLDRPEHSISPQDQPWIVLPRPWDPPDDPPATLIGPPILEFRFDEVDTQAFEVRAHQMLKAHADAFTSVIGARRIGVHHGLVWKPGGMPTLSMLTTGGDASDLRVVFDALCDPLLRAEAILGHAWDEKAELRAEFTEIKKKAMALGIQRPGIWADDPSFSR